MKKILTFLTIAALIVVGAVFVKKKKEELASMPTPGVKPVVVETVAPSRGKVEEKLYLTGRYYSSNRPAIATKTPSFVEKIYVKEGDIVKKGDLVAKLDDEETKSSIDSLKESISGLEASLESLKSALEAAAKDMEFAKSVYLRNEALYKAGALSKEKLEESEVLLKMKISSLKKAQTSLISKKKEIASKKAQLKSLKSKLKYLILKAPIDGTVISLNLKEGDFAAAGKPIAVLASNTKRVDFEVPGEFLSLVKPGQKVYIENKTAVLNKILPQTRNYLATLRVEPITLDLPENSIVKAKLVLKEAEGTKIPIKALLEKKGTYYIFIYEDGGFKPQKVTILAKDESFAIIDLNVTNKVAIGSNDKLSKLFFVQKVKVSDNE